MSNRRRKSMNQETVESPVVSNKMKGSTINLPQILKDNNNTNTNEQEATSTEHILQGVVAYIEVRSEDDDRFEGVAKQMEILGAKATKKFTVDVTHVIYKDGKKTTREKAVKKGIPIVTVLWIEECKRTGTRACEDNFAIDLERYNSPFYRPKRTKFMQPRSIEETAKCSAEKLKRRNRRLAKMKERVTPQGPSLIPETWQDARTCSPFVVRPSFSPHFVPRTPGSALGKRVENDGTYRVQKSEQPISEDEEDGGSLIQQIAKKLRFGNANEYIETPSCEESSSEDNIDKDSVHEVQDKKKSRMRKLLSMRQNESPNKDLPDPFQNLPSISHKTILSTNAETNCPEKQDENKKRKRDETDENCSLKNNANCERQNETKSLPASRSSLEDFIAGNIKKKIKKTKKTNDEKESKRKKKKTQCLVMTSMHFSDQDIVLSVVKKLGLFSVQDNVSSQTSHVIAGNERRTLNVLKAITTGCWLLSLEWVIKSLEVGYWLEEEPYELNDFFPSAQLCRLERSTTGDCYRSRLLSDVDEIYVGENTSPSSDEILNLILMSGGHVCNSFRKASICIGQVPKATGALCLSERWLLDCITSQTVLPFENYKKDISLVTGRPRSPTF